MSWIIRTHEMPIMENIGIFMVGAWTGATVLGLTLMIIKGGKG